MRLERNSFECDVIATYLFQFHKGAIRTLLSNLSENVTLNFNSIKVRLEQSIADHSFEGYSRFQFHKGAIRTFGAVIQSRKNDKFQFHKGAIRTELSCSLQHHNGDFNSIKVRLEPGTREDTTAAMPISIP